MTGFVGWFAFGYVWLELTQTLGFSPEGRQLLAYALGLGLLAIALEAVGRRLAPEVARAEVEGVNRGLGQTTRNTLLSVAVLLWVLWVLRAMLSFWLLLIIVVLPLADAVLDRAIENLLRPPGSPQTSTASYNVVAGPRSTRPRALLAPTCL